MIIGILEYCWNTITSAVTVRLVQDEWPKVCIGYERLTLALVISYLLEAGLFYLSFIMQTLHISNKNSVATKVF